MRGPILPVALVAALSTPASAQMAYSIPAPCIPEALALPQMEEQGFRVISGGLWTDTAIVQTWANDDGEWMVIIRDTDGDACMIARGTSFTVDPLGDPA